MYKHRNTSDSIITIFDSKMDRHIMLPGTEVEIDVKREGNGVIIVDPPRIKQKKHKESDIE